MINEESLSSAMEYLAKQKNPVAKILLAGLEKIERGREESAILGAVLT
jgi:hypothetical protein